MRNLIGLIDACLDAYDRSDFRPNPDGSTHCNQAVQTIAAAAFNYNEWRGMMANAMVDFLAASDSWNLIDMSLAQGNANNGSLVVACLAGAAMTPPASHGHIVVIRPGLQCDSGKWGAVPRCVNIGASDFIARAQTGVLTNMAAGVNDAFIPKPKFYVLRSSL